MSCLIPADGYYEWKKLNGDEKQPYRITLDPERPFSFAGLWERWDKEDEPIESCTIVTTDANELTAEIHNRMPVILHEQDYKAWLDGSAGEKLLKPFPSDEMRYYPVDTKVGNVKNTSAELIEPID